MAARHALLSASSAHRWLLCPPSVRLTEDMEDRLSDFAAQGTDAHELAEHKLKATLGMETEDPTEDLCWYDAEMEECTEAYAAYNLEVVSELKESCEDPLSLIEQEVDFSRWVPLGFGTADAIHAGDGMLAIIDFKYGRGVEVSAERNPQMMLYALGALELIGCLYNIDRVRMCIFQPRLSNVSTYEMAVEELLAWAEGELAEKARLAHEGKGDYASGEHCRFCRAKAVCRKRAEDNLEVARIEFAPPATLTDEEIAEVLGKADALASWAADVKEHALRQALSGKRWAGFKLVEGRSNRRYTDEAAVAEAVEAAGCDPFEKRLLGITAMTKLLGRKRFDELLSPYVEKPKGKPALVPETDRRKEITTAIQDFEEKEQNHGSIQ